MTAKNVALNATIIPFSPLHLVMAAISRTVIIVAVLVIVFLTAGCITQSIGKTILSFAPKAVTPTPGPEEISIGPVACCNSTQSEHVIVANNRFSMELYSAFAADSGNAGKNIFFSPLSISSAFAVVREGARGTTDEQIQKVFHFPQNSTVMRQEYRDMKGCLDQCSNAGITTANALWGENSASFLPGFTRLAEEFYGANTTNLDFVSEPEGSRRTINAWMEEHTNDQVHNLMPEGSVTRKTKLVVTNAIYFLGKWQYQFNPNYTSEENFTVSPRSVTKVPLMIVSDGNAKYSYAENDRFQAIVLPYRRNTGMNLSMLVILPKEDSLERVEATLDTTINNVKMSSAYQHVQVIFPKFRLDTTYNLQSTLSRIGMPDAFTDKADFSGMDGEKDIVITNVIHKAFVEVDEEGTKAAAATGASLGPSGGPPPAPVFRADHPFIFIIQDDDTGNIIFMGRLSNPNE